MPLDTSIYPLTRLRTDGRRWNELRRLHAQISTHTASDGSAYLEMGNTKILCVVTGPAEQRGGQRREGKERDEAQIVVEINQAPFASVDRKKRTKGDRRLTEMQNVITKALSTALFLGLYPHSTITMNLHVLSLDGSLLAGCLNVATLALIDAGVPMKDYICACTCGLSPLAPSMLQQDGGDTQDPLLDLNNGEEQEVPYLTVATLGAQGDKVVVLSMERKVRFEVIEGMMATGIDGCRKIRSLLDQTVKEKGAKLLSGDNAGR